MTNTTNQVNQANTDNTMTKAIDTVKNVTEKVTGKVGCKMGNAIYALAPNHYERVINVAALSGQLSVILYSNRKGKRDLKKYGMAKATVMSIPFGLVAATTCSLIGQTFLAAERTCRHLKAEQSKAK